MSFALMWSENAANDSKSGNERTKSEPERTDSPTR
jgi:hypothetical protein